VAPLIVISHYQARPLLQAREQGAASATTSLDLALTSVDLALDSNGVPLPDGQLLTWEVLEAIAADESGCYLIEEGEGRKIQAFSEYLNRAYTLYPTPSAPTMLISGLPMHRIKGTDPRQDTLAKARTVNPLAGTVLDTAMGLGYTATEAARTADKVLTIELDPTVEEICRLNPWSQELFENSKITRRSGDAFDVIETLQSGVYSRIIHDPPTFSLAGHLYSQEFYKELYRVLTRKGLLFHYIGDLNSRSGAGVARGVRQRLAQAGFRRVVDKPRAFGVVASK
jgi:predicted methyltransferase